MIKCQKEEVKLNLEAMIDNYLGLKHQPDSMDKALVLLGDEDIAHLIGLDRSARILPKKKVNKFPY
jgi:hypothetical protein